jgi:Mg2+-importing ATPase
VAFRFPIGPRPATQPAIGAAEPPWAISESALFQLLDAGPGGLSTAEAERRLALPENRPLSRHRVSDLALLGRQFASPLPLLLIGAAVLAGILRDTADAAVILVIVVASGLLTFHQERGARKTVERLLALVSSRTRVLRDGAETEILSESVVPGDVILLSAGDWLPADCRVLESTGLMVDESALTGESFPAEKQPGTVAAEATVSQRTNSLFMGTYVVSGSGRAIAAATGQSAEFGRVFQRLAQRPAATDFERGVRRFGFLLAQFTFVLVIAIFAINVYFNRPVIESLLFSVALAVGLTPQLLPAIIGINLAHGARRMAARRVIVRQLDSIENFGSMDILCSDKTGTVTEGEVRVEAGLDPMGAPSGRVLLLGRLNATFQTGFRNPIDAALAALDGPALDGYAVEGEIPYDFVRKRLSLLLRTPGGALMFVTKGAVPNVLELCGMVEAGEGAQPIGPRIDEIRALADRLGAEGYRALAVAVRPVEAAPGKLADLERDLTLAGFLVLADPPKPGVEATIQRLERLGIGLKVITGDNRAVAAHVARAIGLSGDDIVTGHDLLQLHDDALPARAAAATVFAEIEPNQKERIVRALQRGGHVVGFLGDGINDAPALRAADVGISVSTAVDVAREAADIVLLEKDLGVLEDGVVEGRKTFANTLKYVYMATSANFGNMFSMAGASLFLSYLPLLPKQILTMNLITDLPETAIANDRVDDELVQRPERWDIGSIRRFMLVFGAISSVFDYATFGVLLLVLNASMDEFRTGWFMESIVSAAVVVLVVRTRHAAWRSRPSRGLAAATAGAVAVAVATPFTPLAGVLGLVHLPWTFFPALAAIVVAYVLSAELAKQIFYRRLSRTP